MKPLQYLRDNSTQTPLSTAIGVNVFGDSRWGQQCGNADRPPGSLRTAELHVDITRQEFREIWRASAGVHEVNLSSAGFNGNYTFPDITTYSNAQQGLPDGSPTQYSINDTPSGAAATVPVTMVDAGLYVQDDWKVRPNLTLSGGLRFETQNAIHDHADWAPRLGFAWGIGGGGKSAPKTVLRGGFGLSTIASAKA